MARNQGRLKTDPRRARRFLRYGAAVGVAVILMALIYPPDGLFQQQVADGTRTAKLRLAVLGDSDSQGFQDSIWYPRGGRRRGGRNHDITFQWTEIIDRMRGEVFDLGEHGVWGGRQSLVRLLRRFGLQRRLPRKEDHQFNFAFAGAACRDLVSGEYAQVDALLQLVSAAPMDWRRAVVIIRIGIIDLGGSAQLVEMARDPDSPALCARIDQCVAHVRDGVARLLAADAELRVGLVGILNNVDHPPQFSKFRSAECVVRINRALDRYDGALRALAAEHSQVAFFDDREWFRNQWGGRDAQGAPDYGVVKLGSHRVVHAMSDDPRSSVLADGHAGLAWNLLWAKAVVDWMIEEFDVRAQPLDMVELGAFFDAQVARAVR